MPSAHKLINQQLKIDSSVNPHQQITTLFIQCHRTADSHLKCVSPKMDFSLLSNVLLLKHQSFG